MCDLCVLVKRESQIVEVDSGKFPNGQVTGCHSEGKQRGVAGIRQPDHPVF